MEKGKETQSTYIGTKNQVGTKMKLISKTFLLNIQSQTREAIKTTASFKMAPKPIGHKITQAYTNNLSLDNGGCGAVGH